MNSLKIDLKASTAQRLNITDDALAVDLADGRTLTVPLAWFPRLAHGTLSERENWRFIGNGEGIHWASLDEDISVQSLLAGQPSCETQESLRKWLKAREKAD